MTRKGDPTDMFLLLVILFFLAISFVVTLFTNNIIQNIISTTALNTSAAYPQINQAFGDINSFVVQRGFVIFFGILVVGIMVSSFLIRVHPVFLFIYILTLGTAIFVSIYLANSYELVTNNPQLAALSANYETITFVMQHIALILLAVGALSMIIIFSKIGGGGTSNPTDI